ncbi:cytosolic carboxypeptidase 1 [Plakobranchus ocellatus]|uniref:tubulin-glutamate carboxypeptidase n=1 Tax=Plakobranchus ocellatus TaxID=259542 RepID=A0AAV4AK14_9GAST|nr:cytosolic carboxypeptidase 1 [Plakobranchus ocellatus]
MRAVPILGGLSRPLCYYSNLCPTQQEADQFQKYFGCSSITCLPNRLGYWINHISKLLNRNLKKVSVEDLQQLKHSTSKLFQLVQQGDKTVKEGFIKQQAAVDTLIAVLQIVTCDQIVSNVISIFIEVVGKIQSAKRASVLVNHGLTTVLFQIMKLAHTGDICLPDEVLVAIHILLSRVGHKDRKFAVKARLHQSLMLTLNMVKSNSHNFRTLQPLLSVLKMYTNNSVNASYLGKHNSINIMFKIISACGRRHTADLRLTLENLNNMTKSKSNSARLVGMGGVPQLLALHADWQAMDVKNRFLLIRKSVLNILKNITNLKSGRKALLEADGIRILYESSLEASDCRDMESMILLASVIMRKCCPRNKLPITSTLNPVLFPLPQSPTHTPECYFLPNFPVPVNESQSRVNGTDSDHSSLDDDDDIDSDDERFRTDQDEPYDDQPEGPEPAEKRTPEDLHMYDTFFPELYEEPEPPGYLERPNIRRSVSGFLSSRPSEFQFHGMKHVSSDATLYDLHKRSGKDFSTSVDLDPRSGQCKVDEKSVSAINLKTGSSVISLDLIGFRQQHHQPGGAPAPSSTRRSLIPSSRTSKQRRRPSQSSQQLSRDSRRNGNSIRRLSSTRFDDSSASMEGGKGSAVTFPSIDSEESDQVVSFSSDDLDEDFCEFSHDAQLYSQTAADTYSVHRFQKLAFPDLYGARGPVKFSESLVSRKFGVQRAKIFEDIDRMIHSEQLVDKVVYDLDAIVADAGDKYTGAKSNLLNRDELRVGYIDSQSDTLKFNAQFECGNLRKAIQVRRFEYDLILSPDINSNHHHQWFYFEVSNMLADQPYRFNIVNCEKLNSQFNYGMQPLMMSVLDAIEGNPCWLRVGTDVCYYKNHFIRNANTTGGVKGKSYYTATFTITFRNAGDVCYISYHYPYTYTALQTHLKQWEKMYDQSQIYYRNQNLCTTLGGNEVPVLTITAQPRSMDKESLEEMRSRPYIFLSARVHPGESNASWIMKGTIDFLLSRKPQAQLVREMYIFKIVPMLNPDGVLNGNHRSSLVGEDLNRRWGKPCPVLHPTIYHTKGLLLYLNMINKTPMVYCDYHGHSRRKNIFMYGCSPSQSWIPNDTQNPCCTGNKFNDASFKILPRLLNTTCPSFSLKNCNNMVEKVKENTARVVVWRQLNVVRSYTMESSYCGCDEGKYKDAHINTEMLEEMGHTFCETLIKLARQKGSYDQQMPLLDIDNMATASGEAVSEIELDDVEDISSLSLQKGHCELTTEYPATESDDEERDEEEEEFDDDEELDE